MEKNLYRTISELFPGARRQIVLLIKVRPVWRTSLFLRYQHDRSGDGSLLQKLRLNFENLLQLPFIFGQLLSPLFNHFFKIFILIAQQ